jgi:hypothetical protein
VFGALAELASADLAAEVGFVFEVGGTSKVDRWPPARSSRVITPMLFRASLAPWAERQRQRGPPLAAAHLALYPAGRASPPRVRPRAMLTRAAEAWAEPEVPVGQDV